MTRGIENILFTSFIGLVIIVALFISLDWPVRASIVILLLGSIGIVLTATQLVFDFKVLRGDRQRAEKPTFEVAALEHQGRWGSLEIWAWLWGLFFAIHLIGMPIALPLFVFLYQTLAGADQPPRGCRRVSLAYSSSYSVRSRNPGSGSYSASGFGPRPRNTAGKIKRRLVVVSTVYGRHQSAIRRDGRTPRL
jgi:hypothetical protein